MGNTSHFEMLKYIAALRTILKDYDEQLLKVSFRNNFYKEIIKYQNQKLILYKVENKTNKLVVKYNLEDDKYNFDFKEEIAWNKKQKLTLYKVKNKTNKTNKLIVKYNLKDDKYNFDFKEEIAENYMIDNFCEKVEKILKYINNLKYVKAISLDKDAKGLIEIYRLFYDENPDFSSQDINIKIQTMMSILVQFGISLGEKYAFNFTGPMPSSYDLYYLINRLYPFGIFESQISDVKITEDNEKVIRTVGKYIRNYISDGYNKNEALMNISKIIYCGRYDLLNNCDVKELVKYSECTNNEVESSISLIRKIEEKIKND